MQEKKRFSENSTVGEVIRDPVFSPFGRLLFPVDLSIPERMTLKQVSRSDVLLWYTNLHAEKTVEILNELYKRASSGETIFYPIYSEQEQCENPDWRQTGLFYLRGSPGERFAIVSAGGGFYYVGAMHDSFPHALELSRRGCNAFVLIYRPKTAWQDLGRAICFVEDHAEQLEISPAGYSLWGGSAGARMAAVLRRIPGGIRVPDGSSAGVRRHYAVYGIRRLFSGRCADLRLRRDRGQDCLVARNGSTACAA